MFLVGIMGAKGAGKDTVADTLCAASGGRKLSMATPLKNMLIALGVPPEAIEDREAKEAPCAALDGAILRWGMQSLGTEWGRKLISPNLWVSRVEAIIVDHWRANPQVPVIIPDVRFPNEVDMIRRNGGVLIRVRRPSVEPSFSPLARLRRLVHLDAPLHPSETLWRVAPCNVDIWNEGDRTELAIKVASVMAGLPALRCAFGNEEAYHGA